MGGEGDGDGRAGRVGGGRRSRLAADGDEGVGDHDEGLWIPDAKTEAGKRTRQVPDVLQPYLKGLAEGKTPQEKLFGDHWRDWVRKWVKRICLEAKVPQVTAHGMRGLHSTLALEHGASDHVVASSLGHESFSTTVAHYAKPEAIAGARQRRVLTVLDGGRFASSPHLETIRARIVSKRLSRKKNIRKSLS